MEKNPETNDKSAEPAQPGPRKRLSLNRETLRSLTDDELTGVAGASLAACTACTGCSGGCTQCGKHLI